MKTNPASNTILHRLMKTAMRARVFILLIAVLSIPFFSAASASVSESSFRKSLTGMARNAESGMERTDAHAPDMSANNLLGMPTKGFEPLLVLPQAAPVEAITIHQSDCTTPATSFNLGQTVCAKITGAPLGSRPTQILRRLSIVGPGGFIRSKAEVTSGTQTLSFTIPGDATSLIGGESVDNRGTWRALGISTRDGSATSSASFTVRDATQPVADLTIVKAVAGMAEVAAGGFVTFNLYVANYGPDAAANVVIADVTPANTTFQSVSQNSGPSFDCEESSGTTTCTIASLASGTKAKFTLVYQVSSGAPPKTLILNTATITTTTVQRSTRDNISNALVIVNDDAVGGGNCTLDCPANVVVTANTTQGGQPGAFVTYGAATVFGDCGSVTNNPVSGSFFAVGTHTITSSSSAGPSCTFTVKVLGTPAPTISCPTDKTATAPLDSNQATVDPGLPTTTPATGVTVTGTRSDDLQLGDPYQVGVTQITWTVTDADGRTASCVQKITVSANNRENLTISCPANQSFAAAAGECTKTLTAAEIGAPTTNPSDSNVSVEGVRSDGGALTDPFPTGATLITWTATDAANGSVASCEQTITITGNDNTPPTITAPLDVTVISDSCSERVGDEALGSAEADDNCSPASTGITRTGVPAGNIFPVGVTTITYTATDANGNTATDTQTVTVTEATPPTITAPPDATYQCASEVPGAAPGQATASDNCGTPTIGVTETSNGGAGSPASPLIITRTFTATDASGNTASAEQIITVKDSTAPTITAPADATYQCASEVPGANASDATASDNCGGSPSLSVSETNNGGAGSPASPLIITRTFTATDAAGNTSSADQIITVKDTIAPTITAPADATYQCPSEVPGASSGQATASDNCGTAAINVTETSNGGAGSPSSPLVITRTFTATDAAGNTSNDSQIITVIDTTAPVITPAPDIVVTLPPNTSATSMGVSYGPFTATDNCGAPVVVTASPASPAQSPAVFSVGTTNVVVTATDAAGNTSTDIFTVTVLYNFTGFFSPVGNLPTLNSVNAGRAIPVKFSLSGNKGLNIFAANSPYTISINCDGSAPQSDVAETVNAGGSSLSYSSSSDQYNYVWKTESSWANTCRQLVVKLNDGSEHRANFKFK